MRLILITLGFLIAGQATLGQTDSIGKVKYSPDFRFRDGLFLNFGQVKANNPISPTRIVSHNEPGDFNFFKNLVEEKTISYFDEFGSQQTVKSDNIWGFSQDGKLYINHNNEFNRIPIVGQVCHFIADVTVIDHYSDPYYYDRYDYYYNPYYTRPYSRTSRSKEMRQYLLVFETGEIMPYDRESILVILMKDPELYEEYNGLRKRKQKDLMFFFLRRFNEKHPLFLPLR